MKRRIKIYLDSHDNKTLDITIDLKEYEKSIASETNKKNYEFELAIREIYTQDRNAIQIVDNFAFPVNRIYFIEDLGRAEE